MEKPTLKAPVKIQDIALCGQDTLYDIANFASVFIPKTWNEEEIGWNILLHPKLELEIHEAWGKTSIGLNPNLFVPISQIAYLSACYSALLRNKKSQCTIHASALGSEKNVVLLLGGAFSGKTTVALVGMLERELKCFSSNYSLISLDDEKNTILVGGTQVFTARRGILNFLPNLELEVQEIPKDDFTLFKLSRTVGETAQRQKIIAILFIKPSHTNFNYSQIESYELLIRLFTYSSELTRSSTVFVNHSYSQATKIFDNEVLSNQRLQSIHNMIQSSLIGYDVSGNPHQILNFVQKLLEETKES